MISLNLLDVYQPFRFSINMASSARQKASLKPGTAKYEQQNLDFFS